MSGGEPGRLFYLAQQCSQFTRILLAAVLNRLSPLLQIVLSTHSKLNLCERASSLQLRYRAIVTHGHYCANLSSILLEYQGDFRRRHIASAISLRPPTNLRVHTFRIPGVK
ncbi:unnamed protein product [Mesocestoides corti]|nr:unnamed protein product [Mesocestoides corti]